MHFIVVLEHADTCQEIMLAWLSCVEGMSSQLIQPKLTKRQQKAPKTTDQASNPPSGKALGSIKDILVDCLSNSTFLNWSEVSGLSLSNDFECMVSRMSSLGPPAAFSWLEALVRVEDIEVVSSLDFSISGCDIVRA